MTRTMLKLPGIQPGVALNPCFGLPTVKRALTMDGGPTSFIASSFFGLGGFSRLGFWGVGLIRGGDSAPHTIIEPPQQPC